MKSYVKFLRAHLAYLIVVGLLGITLLIPVGRAAAQNRGDVLRIPCADTPNAVLCQDDTQAAQQNAGDNALFGPDGILTRVAGFFAILTGIGSIIMIMIGGFRYITSAGDPSNVKTAKDTILYALIGIAVTVCAQSIVVLVLNRL